jgi:hypothetical protein
MSAAAAPPPPVQAAGTACVLRHFLVFHRQLGSSEEDASAEERQERLLYVFPPVTPMQDSLSLLESIAAFIDFGNFAVNGRGPEPCVADLGATRFVLVPVDEDLWFACGVAFDPVPAAPDDTSLTWRLLSAWTGPRPVKGGPALATIDASLISVVTQMYGIVKLCLGNVCELATGAHAVQVQQALRAARKSQSAPSSGGASDVKAHSPLEALRRGLKRLAPVWLDGIAFARLHCYYELDHVCYTDLDRVAFLSVQSVCEAFVTRMAAKALRRHATMLLYRGHVVWTCFPTSQTTLVSRLVERIEASGLGVLGDSGEGFLRLGVLLSTPSEQPAGHHGSKMAAPRIHLPDGEVGRVVAYRRRHATLVFVLQESLCAAAASAARAGRGEPGGAELDAADGALAVDAVEEHVSSLLLSVDRMLADELTRLALVVADSLARPRSVAPSDTSSPAKAPAYVYVNHANASLFASELFLGGAPRSLLKLVLPGDLANALDGPISRAVDLAHRHLKSAQAGTFSVCVLASGGGHPVWVCGRKAHQRLLVMVLPLVKSAPSMLASLSDATWEFERWLEILFGKVLL